MKPTIRASEVDRVLRCPGSLTLNALVDDRDGDDGFEGTFLHWQIADRLIRELGATPPEGGLQPPEVPAGFKVNPFAAWIVEWAVQHVRWSIPRGWSLLVEQGFAYEFDRWIASGHADVIGISPDATHSKGIDWKTGPVPVMAAEQNNQVLEYIVLKKLAWPTLQRCEFDIAQPRNDEDEGFPRVSSAALDGEVLGGAPSFLDDQVTCALDRPMEQETGLKQCRFCPGSPTCATTPGMALYKELQLMKATLTPEMLANIRTTPDDPRLGDFVVSARTLRKPIEDAEKMVKERVKEAGYVDAGCGVRITVTKEPGSYEVPNPDAFLAKLEELIPDRAKRAKCIKPTMTNLKDVIADVFNVPKTGKAAETAATIFDANFRPLVVQKEKEVMHLT